MPFRWPCAGRDLVAYAIAAYAVVIGTLAAYAGWAQSQRRQLMREADRAEQAGQAGQADRDGCAG
jgi:hypothetical protein